MTNCTCNSESCRIRSARGLLPFCRMSAPVAEKFAGFRSYAAAQAAKSPGQRIRCLNTYGDGKPKMFVLEGK